MQTTLELPDSLLEEARLVAAEESSTVAALVEEGLRKLLVERGTKAAFRLRRASFKGNGLQPPLADASWEQIREITLDRCGSIRNPRVP